MLRSPSEADSGARAPAPAEALGLASDEAVLASGGDLAARAFAILQAEGVSPGALAGIGVELAALAGSWRGFGQGEALFERQPGEYPLWCEEDGTFELVLRLLRAGQESGPALGYDTWTVFAPLQGRLHLHWVKDGVPKFRELAPGDSLGLPAGCASLPAAPKHSGAALLCLFGIARQLLPLPLRVDLSAERSEGTPP